MMYIRTDRTDSGFTLVEAVIYAAGAALLIGVIVTALFYAYRWYRYLTVAPRVDQVGAAIVERIEDDIRAGQSLDSGKDAFGVAAGSIGINALDASKNPVSYFYALQNGTVVYSENNGSLQDLSPSDLHVSQLIFTQLTSGVSTAVHFTVGIDYPTQDGTTTADYSGLAIMRNSYH